MPSVPTPLPKSALAATAPPLSHPHAARPVVVALMGLPGSGKSTVARALVEELGLRCVDRDVIRAALFPRCRYSFMEKRAAFRALLLALEINCVLGESTVIDGCTFSRRQDLLRVDQVVRKHGFQPVAIHLDCPADLARKRIEHDLANARHPARDRSPDLVAEVLARFEAPPPGSLSIDARQSADVVSRIAVKSVAALAGIPFEREAESP
jgi:predicted kinase